jgi:hypothetical protein
VGRRTTLFWECRAYKRTYEGVVQPPKEVDDELSPEVDAYADDEGEGEVDTEEADITTITPARAFDKKVAYQEACARIDGLEGPIDRRHTANLQSTYETLGTAAIERTIQDVDDGRSERVDQDFLAAEFSTSPKLRNLPPWVHKVANQMASHRRHPRHRPRS